MRQRHWSRRAASCPAAWTSPPRSCTSWATRPRHRCRRPPAVTRRRRPECVSRTLHCCEADRMPCNASGTMIAAESSQIRMCPCRCGTDMKLLAIDLKAKGMALPWRGVVMPLPRLSHAGWARAQAVGNFGHRLGAPRTLPAAPCGAGDLPGGPFQCAAQLPQPQGKSCAAFQCGLDLQSGCSDITTCQRRWRQPKCEGPWICS